MADTGYLTQTRRTFLRGAGAAALLSALAVLALAPTRALQWLESGAYDAIVRASVEPERASRSIVVIDIDNASFDQLKEHLGRWPWSRRIWTETLRYVARGQPRVVAFDIVFGGSENVEVDSEFARVLRSSGNAVLAFSFSPTEMDLEENATNLRKLKLLERDSWMPAAGRPGRVLSLKEYALNVPLEELGAVSAGLASVNAIPDPDGVIRRVALDFRLDDRVYPSFSLRVADLAERATEAGSQYETAGGALFLRAGRRIPLDASGNMILRWHGSARDLPEGGAYDRIPIWQIICSIYPDQCPPEAPRFAPEFFRDKIVLVAASAAGSYDAHPTPFGERDPGFFAHATAIDNLLQGEAVQTPPRWFLPVAVFLLALAGAVVPVRFASGAGGGAAVAALMAVYGGAAFLALDRWALWLPMIAPQAALLVAWVSSGAIRYATTGRELRRTRGTLDRYISPELVNYVLENLETIQLGGEKKVLTILFSDVRNFTTLSEKADPVELIRLLNEYLEAMTEIIFKYDGIVDKFIGDGILAYWGAFTPGKNHAELAARASLEMLERLAELNRGWAAEGRKEIAIGIGLNTGEVIFGNVGSGKKIEFTVIGDPVNLASRLEGLNKQFGTTIIISDTTYRGLGNQARVRPLGGVQVKGKTVETAVFELLGLDGGSVETETRQNATPSHSQAGN